jgi:hypothetical protein
MFGRWFRRAVPVEDRVWIDAAACRRGVPAQVEQALRQRGAILLLARSYTDREDLAHELATRAPRVGSDRFAADDLRAHLRTPAALGLACVDDLRPTAASGPHPALLEIHVLGRDPRREGDRALLDLLGNWAPTRIVFHHSLDDALLRAHAASLQPLLQKLGMRADEPIVSPLLTRAIERAQRP